MQINIINNNIKEIQKKLEEHNIKESGRLIGGEHEEAIAICFLKTMLPEYAIIETVPKEDQLSNGDIRVIINGVSKYIEVKKSNFYAGDSLVWDYKYYNSLCTKYRIQENTKDHLGWGFRGENVDYMIAINVRSQKIYIIDKVNEVKDNMIAEVESYISNCERAKECFNYYDKIINIDLENPNEFYFMNGWAKKEDNLKINEYITLARVPDYDQKGNITKLTLGIGTVFTTGYVEYYGGKLFSCDYKSVQRVRVPQKKFNTIQELINGNKKSSICCNK